MRGQCGLSDCAGLLIMGEPRHQKNATGTEHKGELQVVCSVNLVDGADRLAWSVLCCVGSILPYQMNRSSNKLDI